MHRSKLDWEAAQTSELPQTVRSRQVSTTSELPQTVRPRQVSTTSKVCGQYVLSYISSVLYIDGRFGGEEAPADRLGHLMSSSYLWLIKWKESLNSIMG